MTQGRRIRSEAMRGKAGDAGLIYVFAPRRRAVDFERPCFIVRFESGMEKVDAPFRGTCPCLDIPDRGFALRSGAASVVFRAAARRPGAPQPPAPPGTSAPSLSILGIPTVIKAPVAKPYCNCATQPNAGQPMRSGDILFGPEPDRAQ